MKGGVLCRLRSFDLILPDYLDGVRARNAGGKGIDLARWVPIKEPRSFEVWRISRSRALFDRSVNLGLGRTIRCFLSGLGYLRSIISQRLWLRSCHRRADVGMPSWGPRRVCCRRDLLMRLS